MTFELSQEQRQTRDVCRAFAEQRLVPNARRWDTEKVFPADALKSLGELGLMGVTVPAEWGGAGMDTVTFVVAMEEISRGCASTAATVGVNKLYCDVVLNHGTDEQRQGYLLPFARGERLGAFALTEPQSGSDAADVRVTATIRGSEYVLNGTKSFITNGPRADAVVVFTSTDRAKGSRGITAFLVPTDTPGLSRGRLDDKVGLQASPSCQLSFEECRVSRLSRLGEEGEGFKIAMSALDGGRIGIGAQAVGIARAACEKAIAYAKDRQAFGKPIAQHQAISFMLADMATEIEAARLLVWRAASLKDRGAPFGTEAAMAKLYASEMAERVTSKAIQILGGFGYMKEGDVERHWRDSRVAQIYEGTSEIQRVVISKALLK
ncbi:MAG TPA: acyl-CoA dehydrogenase family protein [Anaeromyxobacteraceae bacterium]|nr:acyl-CoA dehydrogenase family protein [Anaeromyxobacteraceae bacterium]